MYENITITGAKLLKGPKVEVSYLLPDKIPGSFGPSTNEPHTALIAAFKSLDPHCAAMLGRTKDADLHVKGKKGEVKHISFKPSKEGEEEEWIGHDWHVNSFVLTHNKSGDGIILGYTETLFNGKAHNSTVPLYRLGEENGYLYIEGLMQCVKVCEAELIKYMQAPPVQQEMQFEAPPLNGGNIVQEFPGTGEPLPDSPTPGPFFQSKEQAARVMVNVNSGEEEPF